MRITQEADYGLRVVLHLSRLGAEERVGAGIIAEEEKLPLRFLLKLLRKLIKADIVKSYRGVSGGYSIAKAPASITLKDVIEAIDGPISMNRCVLNPSLCNASKGSDCEIHKALCRVQRHLIADLEGITFDDLKNGYALEECR